MHVIPYILIALIAAGAVLSHEFKDNLAQRVGLSCIGLGAAVKAYLMLLGYGGLSESSNLLAWGLLLYAIGTYFKVRKHA